MGSVTPTPITAELLKSGPADAEVGNATETITNPSVTEAPTEDSKIPVTVSGFHDPTYSPVKGILFSIMTTISIVTSRGIFKYIDDVPFFDLHFATFIMQATPTLLCLIFVQKDDYKFAWQLKYHLLMQSLAACISLVLERFSIINLPLGTCTTIFYIRPILVLIVARMLNMERITWTKTGFALVAIVGVALVVRPPFLFQSNEDTAEGPWWAYLTAFIQAIFVTAYVLYLRFTKDVSFIIIQVVNVIIGFFFTATLLVIDGYISVPHNGMDYLWISLTGIFMFIGAFCMVLSHHYYTASALSTARALDVVLSFIYGILLFGDRPPAICIVGAVLIVSSVIGLGVSEIIKARKRNKMSSEEN